MFRKRSIAPTKHAPACSSVQWQWAVFIFCFAFAFGGSGAATACSLAIRNVAVVTLISGRVEAGQTVLIDGARIVAVGPAGVVNVTDCNQVVEGRGAFLAPGLIDAHVHVESASFAGAFGQPASPIAFDDVLALYPRFGVTAVRVMSGAPDILAYRDAVPSGAPIPRLVVASPMIAGTSPVLPPPITRVVETKQAARLAVEEFARAGYDLVKVRENVGFDALHAVLAAADKAGLGVDGHVPRTMGPIAAVNAGQQGFAHLDEVARAMAEAGVQGRVKIIEALKRHKAHVTSAMIVLKNASEQVVDYDRLAQRSNARALHPMLTSTFWSRAQDPSLRPGVTSEGFLKLLDQSKQALRDLNDAGVVILAGSDALNPMIIPGESLHEELALMVDAGLTPLEAIRTATTNPAGVLKRLANAGVIAPGRDADLVLLSANPLQDIAAYREPKGVVLQGRWFDRSALDRRVEEVVQSFHPSR